MPHGHSGSARHTDSMVIHMPRSLICPTVIQTLPGTQLLPGMLMTKVHTEHWQALERLRHITGHKVISVFKDVMHDSIQHPVY